jgi:hypothetical protein
MFVPSFRAVLVFFAEPALQSIGPTLRDWKVRQVCGCHLATRILLHVTFTNRMQVGQLPITTRRDRFSDCRLGFFIRSRSRTFAENSTPASRHRRRSCRGRSWNGRRRGSGRSHRRKLYFVLPSKVCSPLFCLAFANIQRQGATDFDVRT